MISFCQVVVDVSKVANAFVFKHYFRKYEGNDF